MAIQNRRGAYENYDPNKMVAGEFAVATDEQKLFIAFAPGLSKQILTEDDQTQVDNAINSTSENPVQNKVINTALNSKAPIASPTFTGTPKAPTAAVGTSSTQIATTSFVRQEINAIPSPVKKIWTGTCASTASIAEKVVSLNDSTDFSLEDGVTIAVYFSTINNAQNATLNVNNTGAKPIAYYYYDYDGVHTVGTEDPYYRWSNGMKVFTYKTNRWIMMTADTRWVSYLLENSRTTLTATDQGSGVVSLSIT